VKRILLTYLGVFIGYTILFFALLHSPFLYRLNVLFYRGIIVMFVCILVTGVIGFFVKKRFRISTESFVAALMMTLALHVGFFIVFPVTYDRSVTTYMLYKLDTKTDADCNGINKKNLERYFIKEYVQNQKALDRRIHEQLTIDSIMEKNGCLTLTNNGKVILRIADFVKWIYNIR